MTDFDRTQLANALNEIAIQAGTKIMEIYDRGAEVREKSDKSPVTDADEAGEEIILAGLAKVAPSIPVVAEESAAAGNIPDVGDCFVLVDPLDGTKEFINRNGEFTVNIALIEHGVPTLGVVYAPAKKRLFAVNGDGTAMEAVVDCQADNKSLSNMRAITVNQSADAEGLIVVASRSHRDKKTDELLAAYKVKDMVAAGSSLKFCLVATGEADLYPRHGRTMEWDTAAGDAVLRAAGGTMTKMDGSPFTYGKPQFENPFFIARGPSED
ncbi:MAG: 3'(2'),5'-bisphosphate nucleotidase CysQ [Alphaproteobacteria bacterium]